MEVFVCAPFLNKIRFNSVVFPQGSSIKDVVRHFEQQTGVPSDDVFVCRGNRLSRPQDPLQHGATYQLAPRLCGGKGGFGSMLRALGAQIEKTTNREACRDLSGRRLRDVNHEKEMAAWLEKQEEREAEKEQRRLERLQRKLAEPKHVFSDGEYQRQCNELDERLEESVLKGLQVKRRNVEQNQHPAKKKQKTESALCFWTGAEHLLSSEDEDESPSTSSCGPAVTITTPEKRTQEAEPGLGRAAAPQSSSCSSTTADHRRPPEDEKPAAEQTDGPPEDEKPAAEQTDGPPEDEKPATEQTDGPPEDEKPATGQTDGAPEDEKPATEQTDGPPEDEKPATEQTDGPPEDEKPATEQTDGPPEDEKPATGQTDGAPEDEKPATEQTDGPPEDEKPATEQTDGPPEDEKHTAEQTDGAPEDEKHTAEQTDGPPEDEKPTAEQTDGPGEEKPAEVSQVDLWSCTSQQRTLLALDSVTSVQQLEDFGLDVLKEALMSRGLKCGGTLAERAARLFSVRGLKEEEIDRKLFAKKK